MGYRELIEALRKEGEQKIHSIQVDADAAAAKTRKEALERIGRMRQDCEGSRTGAVREQGEKILSDAGRKARMVLLSAEKELSDRLYSAAARSLALLRDKSYPDVFEALVRELPPHHWRFVRVNPADEERAKGYFPDSEIISDGGIAGGLDVTEKDGKIRVVNTFEKRLENIWMELLPTLMKDIHARLAEKG